MKGDTQRDKGPLLRPTNGPFDGDTALPIELRLVQLVKFGEKLRVFGNSLVVFLPESDDP